ncbi:unnamed protein product [Trichogramma brassicae]|uniref:C2H2-type domain-containing protein n=1 Tax=Trichogramma brassicae TaxID=86971 RepID=A0A6H5HZK4_9HYME|nr:unnamed protein product [Trichogramma brassicae]
MSLRSVTYVLASSMALDIAPPQLPRQQSRVEPAPSIGKRGFVVARLDSRTLLFYCDSCPHRSIDHADFQLHVRSHHADTWPGGCFVCPRCGLTYESQSGLDVHHSYMHDEARLKCRSCYSAFGCEAHLRSHESSVHRTSRRRREPQRADNAGRFFYPRIQQRASYNQQERKYRCSTCSRIFKGMRNLLAHRRQAHPKLSRN